jgi:site-specific DNA-methyltransferase (adenine-specific)
MAPRSRPVRIRFGRGRSVVLWAEDGVSGLSRRLGPGAADVVVTSPPYNIGVRYSRYRDDRPRAEYLAWTGRVGAAVAEVLAPRGSFFLNLAGKPKDPWLPWDVAREVGRSLVLQNVIHWVKSIAIDRRAAGRAAGLTHDLALGHYKPVVSDRFLHGAHEYVFHFSHRGDVRLDRLAIGVPYQDKSNVGRWRRPGVDRRCRGNTWFLPYPTIRERARDRPHPASFPPELAEACVRLHGLPRTRRVVDPFVGIGSSAVAAVRLGVDLVGFDVDPEYLRVAARRVRRELADRRRGSPSSTADWEGSPSRAEGTTPSSGSA